MKVTFHIKHFLKCLFVSTIRKVQFFNLLQNVQTKTQLLPTLSKNNSKTLRRPSVGALSPRVTHPSWYAIHWNPGVSTQFRGTKPRITRPWDTRPKVSLVYLDQVPSPGVIPFTFLHAKYYPLAHSWGQVGI